MAEVSTLARTAAEAASLRATHAMIAPTARAVAAKPASTAKGAVASSKTMMNWSRSTHGLYVGASAWTGFASTH